MLSFKETETLITGVFDHDISEYKRRLQEIDAQHTQRVAAARALVSGQCALEEQAFFGHRGNAVLYLAGCTMKPGESPDISTAPYEIRRQYENLSNDITRLQMLRGRVIQSVRKEFRVRELYRQAGETQEEKKEVPV